MLTASINRAISHRLDEDNNTSETLVNFYETTRRSIPEGCHLHDRPYFEEK
jgi:hypothetical protein